MISTAGVLQFKYTHFCTEHTHNYPKQLCRRTESLSRDRVEIKDKKETLPTAGPLDQ